MTLTPISRANSAVLNTSSANKFCYTREQAEKINYCLEMQKVYEEIQLTRLNSPELNPPPHIDFWDTDIGKGLVFIAGVGLGVAVTISFK